MALIVTAALAVVASPAGAAYTNCGSGKACLWTGTNYPGSPNASFGSGIVLGPDMNDRANSIVNNGNYQIAEFFDYSNYTGASIRLNNPARGGQTRDPALSNGTDANAENWSNRISSAWFVG